MTKKIIFARSRLKKKIKASLLILKYVSSGTGTVPGIKMKTISIIYGIRYKCTPEHLNHRDWRKQWQSHSHRYPVLRCSHLQHFIGLLGSFVVGGPDAEVLLVLLAVHALVNGLTGQTVLFLTDWTWEEVD